MDSGILSDYATVAAAVIAAISLVFLCCQMRLSNRQSLFDRRLRIRIIVQKLLEVVHWCIPMFDKSNEPQHAISMLFDSLTNISILQETGSSIYHVLGPEYQLRLHLKLDELRTIAQEVRLVYKGKAGRLIGSFLCSDADLLFAIYQYQIVLSKMQEYAEKFRWSEEEAARKCREESKCLALHKAEDELIKASEKLLERRVSGSIERQVRLVSSPFDYCETFLKRG